MSEDIARLVATINDSPDPSHGDLTPSVHALVRLGLPALPSVLPLMASAPPLVVSPPAPRPFSPWARRPVVSAASPSAGARTAGRGPCWYPLMTAIAGAGR